MARLPSIDSLNHYDVTPADVTLTLLPIVRFAPALLELRKPGTNYVVELESRYDVGVPHRVAVTEMSRLSSRLDHSAFVEVHEASGPHYLDISVDGGPRGLVGELKRRGYRRTKNAGGGSYWRLVERSKVPADLRWLYNSGAGFGDAEWGIMGEQASRRLAWSKEAEEAMSLSLRQHPRLLRYLREELADLLRRSQSFAPTHVFPLEDGSWAFHSDIESHGCGMIVVESTPLGAACYLPKQDWLPCMLQHELVNALAEVRGLGGDFTTSKRYVELRWCA